MAGVHGAVHRLGSDRQILTVYKKLSNRMQGVASREMHLDILHDHEDVICGLNHFIEADDVGVHEQPQDFDLTPHCAEHAVGKSTWGASVRS